MKLYRIFLGRNVGKGGTVSPMQLQSFIDKEVAGRFNGFTVFHAEGYWKGKRERTAVIEYLGHDGDYKAVGEISTAYKEQFNQESVLTMVLEPSVFAY